MELDDAWIGAFNIFDPVISYMAIDPPIMSSGTMMFNIFINGLGNT